MRTDCPAGIDCESDPARALFSVVNERTATGYHDVRFGAVFEHQSGLSGRRHAVRNHIRQPLFPVEVGEFEAQVRPDMADCRTIRDVESKGKASTISDGADGLRGETVHRMSRRCDEKGYQRGLNQEPCMFEDSQTYAVLILPHKHEPPNCL